MTRNQKIVLLWIALALLLLVGGLLWSIADVAVTSQHQIEANQTERAAAGQTAVYEFQATQRAFPLP